MMVCADEWMPYRKPLYMVCIVLLRRIHTHSLSLSEQCMMDKISVRAS